MRQDNLPPICKKKILVHVHDGSVCMEDVMTEETWSVIRDVCLSVLIALEIAFRLDRGRKFG